MAFEFDYTVALSITHLHIDPRTITNTITEFQPMIQTMAGSVKVDARGAPLMPSRNAALTHWCAMLHEEERIDSYSVSLSEFLRDKLQRIAHHKELFAELKREGSLALCINVFMRTNHAASELTDDVLSLCGQLGIAIELGLYANEG